MPARATPLTESRGRDGRPRGTSPAVSGSVLGAGFDHGVFVPFIRMFGSTAPPTLPIVEVSIDAGLDPREHWAIGEALSGLRKEGYLIIAGGLTVHSFENNLAGFSPKTAGPELKEFDNAVGQAVEVQDVGFSNRECWSLRAPLVTNVLL